MTVVIDLPMSVLDEIKDRLQFFTALRPSSLRKLASSRLSDLVQREAPRAKKRLEDLTQRYPSAGPRELAQRLVDSKKSYASMVGGVSGVFGVISVPADLLVMTWLQLQLLTELATLYDVTVVGVSNVGPITAGPWAGRKCIGCSLAVGPGQSAVTVTPWGFASSCRASDRDRTKALVA